MMKKVLYFAILSLFLLTACGESNGSPGPEPISTFSPAPVATLSPVPIATLSPVPAEYAGRTNPFGPEAADEGAKNFKTDCEICHGLQGHGDGPAADSLDPKPKNLAELQKIASDDYLFWRINTGKPGTSMLAWKDILSEEQIWQVISFIRTLK
jgi:mono/diheme cytochrome c family protein